MGHGTKPLDLQVASKVYPAPMEAPMRIAEVAARSGFSPATLRYYEQADLLPPPPRTGAGYRAYDESILARLAFISRAKALGCSLDEIAELLGEWDGGQCAPVQDRLRTLVTAKLSDAEARTAELAAFTSDLNRILAGLGAHTPNGPCDDDCGCVTDNSAALAQATPVSLGTKPLVCTLDSADMPGRLQEWRDVVAHVVDREVIDGGTRVRLDAATPLDQLALLVAAEHGCCSFFAFAITVDHRGVALEVRAPTEAKAVVDSLLAGAA